MSYAGEGGGDIFPHNRNRFRKHKEDIILDQFVGFYTLKQQPLHPRAIFYL